MSNRKKNLIYSAALLSLVLLVYIYRNYIAPKEPADMLVHYSGITMGVINYNVKYLGQPDENLSSSIDQLLKDFNQALSTYIPNSEISRFNKSEDQIQFESDFFFPVLSESQSVWQKSNGAFDPTIKPLLTFWGFDGKEQPKKDTTKLDSVRAIVGFSLIQFDQEKVSKQHPNTQLDFGAIAKGYAVDLVGDLLASKGIDNFFVEIGGEVVTKGINAKGVPWTLAIRDPRYKSTGNNRQAIIAFSGKGMATSGNYENYYEEDGKKYVHTINPITGLAKPSNLLSATVISDRCMTADAWATAFMVMGLEKTQQKLTELPEIDAYLVFDNNGNLESYMTEGFKNYLLEEAQ